MNLNYTNFIFLILKQECFFIIHVFTVGNWAAIRQHRSGIDLILLLRSTLSYFYDAPPPLPTDLAYRQSSVTRISAILHIDFARVE
jgi:hypothetical protein